MVIDEAIILAGGKGTRLKSVLPDLPKPLAPVNGRPFIFYLLDQLDKSMIKQVIISTGYMAEKIEETVGYKYKNLQIEYSREQTPLGTGGAIRLAAERIRNEY